MEPPRTVGHRNNHESSATKTVTATLVTFRTQASRIGSLLSATSRRRLGRGFLRRRGDDRLIVTGLIVTRLGGCVPRAGGW
jgi:hypothetical protein